MLDNFREWLSDNLRYILLGLAGILLLVIAFFAVRLISGLGSSKKNEPQTEQVTEGRSTEAQTEKKTENQLSRDQADVLALSTQYYTARAEKNYDALTELCDVFDDSTRSLFEKQDAAIEAVSNIITYSKAGLTEGSYVVYTYFDAKLTGITTLAPTLREFYAITNEQGKLIVCNNDESQDIQDYMQQLRADDDVQVLIADVDQKLEEKKTEDEDLKAFVDSISTTQNSDSGDGGTDDGSADNTAGGGTAATGTMQVTTEINVRGEASADSTLYGVLSTGTTVEVLENLDSGWSKIRYTVNGNTIEGYVMTQYLTAA